MSEGEFRPSPAQLVAARSKLVPDVLAPGLKVLFCGINPGLYTAAIGHHFGRPGNRFWPALYDSGFTPRLLSPFEDRLLLEWGFGITNMVERATASAAELGAEEILAGGNELAAKVLRFQPLVLAVLGVQAYRQAWSRPKSVIGFQQEQIGKTAVWLLPNPSGLNANYRKEDFTRLFGELRQWVDHNSIDGKPS
jgi:TDG/mug DNA glycosylase family protein